MTSPLEQLNAIHGESDKDVATASILQEEEKVQDEKNYQSSFAGVEIAGLEKREESKIDFSKTKPVYEQDAKIKKTLEGFSPIAYTAFQVVVGALGANLPFVKPGDLMKQEFREKYTGVVGEFIPAVSYLTQEKQQRFLEETRKDPTLGMNMILMDTFWTELDLFFFSKGGGYALNQVGKGLKGTAKTLTVTPVKFLGSRLKAPKISFKPVADTMTWAHKHYENAAHQLLDKKSLIPGDKVAGRITSGTERKALIDAFHGDPSGLKTVMLSDDVNKASRGFRHAIETVIKPTTDGKALIEYELTTQAKAYLNPATVRRNYFIDEFSKRLESSKILNLKMGQLTDRHVEVAMRDVLAKHDTSGILGLRNLKLKDMDIKMFDNAIRFLDEDYRAKAMLWKHMGTPAGSSLRPVRYVMEALDPMYQTIGKIYKPLAEATSRYARYQIGKQQELKAMFTERGLMKIAKYNKDGIPIFKRTALFTPKIEKRASEILRESKKLIDEASKLGTRKAMMEATKAIKQLRIAGLNKVEQETMRSVLGVVYRMNDKLYREYAAWAIPRLVGKIRGTITRHGMREMDKLISQGQFAIGESLKMGNNLKYLDKRYGIQDGLAYIRKGFVEGLKDTTNPWVLPKISTEGLTPKAARLTEETEMKAISDWLEKNLTMGRHQTMFKEYLSMDFPGPQQIDDMTKSLYAKFSPTTKEAYKDLVSKARLERHQSSLDEMLSSKIRHQARQIALHETIEDVITVAKEYPIEITDYIAHYTARVLGVPSSWDSKLATLLTASAGKIERALLHRSGVWDANRAMELSRNINDFTYMGFLGLKPFSAMRNMFQPVLMVPADIGGVLGHGHLLQGYGKLLVNWKPRTAALRQMGILSDYGPELYSSSKFLNFGKQVGRFELPTRADIRRLTMWMFRSSDEMNRYVTGSAAWEHFDWALKKVPALKGLQTRKISAPIYNEFFRKLGTSGRRSSVRAEIEGLVRRGRMQEAKVTYIKDVVADTQYLYGGIDAPLATHKYGAMGRTAAVFQSWWINYGHALQKWAVKGDVPSEKVMRGINFAFSTAMVYTGARSLWGHRTGWTTVGIGPFPQPSAGMPTPPAIQPFFELTGLIVEAAKVGAGAEDPRILTQRSKQLLRTTVNFLPGGLQGQQSFRAVTKAPRHERVEAGLKSLIKFRGWGG